MIKNVGLWRNRIFLILTTMTLFIACQKDDDGSPPLLEVNQNLNSQLQTVTENVSANEIPEIMDYLYTKSNSKGQFTVLMQSDDTTRSNEPDLVIGELQTKEILKVTDQNNKSNYTFTLTSVESNNPTIKSFFNLVVKETSRGLLPFIIEYRPDINWIPNYRNPEDFSQFTGDILYYSIEGIFTAKVTMNLGALVSINQRTNCEDDNSDNTSGGGENPDGNNDGDSSDGDSNSDSSDGDSSDGDSSGDGDWVLVCEEVILVIDSNACGGDPCGISFQHCEFQPQNSPIPPSDGLFRNPCLPDTGDICYQPNNDPCPNGCNADTTGCAEEPENNEDDSNPTVMVIFDLELISDCRLLENLANSPSFQQRMEELIANNSGNTEIAYYGRNDNNDDMNYADDDRFESEEEKQEIVTPTPQDPIDSYIHNHFNNGHGTSSIFSPADLFTLYTLYSQGRITNVNDFVMIVTSPSNSNNPDDDTVYAITISSENDFAEASSLLLSNLYFAENMFSKAGLKANVDPVIAERQMTQIFKDNDMGLNLFRGDINNLTDWTRVRRKNNNNFIERNCN